MDLGWGTGGRAHGCGGDDAHEGDGGYRRAEATDRFVAEKASQATVGSGVGSLERLLLLGGQLAVGQAGERLARLAGEGPRDPSQAAGRGRHR
jgi:hypothetical protein